MKIPGWDEEKQRGYGNLDEELAEALRNAETKEQADEIARKDGHRDAADAADWLATRTRQAR